MMKQASRNVYQKKDEVMNNDSKGLHFRQTIALLVVLHLCLFCIGCGGGWEAYKESYENLIPGPPGGPWEGPERVFVVLETEQVETFLAGMITSGFKTTSGLVLPGIRLSEFINQSGITGTPEPYRYDFTANDGYNLLLKRGGDLMLLPSWENLHHGYFYISDIGDLRVGWDSEQQPWGGAVSAYNVKYMDGGVMTLLQDGQ